MSLLQEDDRQRIVRAVVEAELRTGIEIVPVIASASSSYRLGLWRGICVWMAVGSLAGLGLGIVPVTGSETFRLILPLLGMFLGAAGFGACATVLPGTRRRFVKAVEVQAIVSQAAQAQYYCRKLGDTRDETGILVYLSLAEAQARIFPDRGVLKKIDQNRWTEVARRIEKYLQIGEEVRAMVEGLEMIGRLADGEIDRRPDDTNELPDIFEIEYRE